MDGHKCSKSCDLCGSNHRSKHVHTAGWLKEHADRCEFLKRTGMNLSTIACVCMACNTAILRGTRLLMDGKLPQQYMPRWCKQVVSSNCCIPDCTTEARVMNHPYSWDVICEHVGSAAAVQPQHSSTLPLCMAHYLQLGRLSKPESAGDITCKVCGLRRPHKQTQTRYFVTCPEPKQIESYLRETADFDSSLSVGDMVCYSCYKYCKQILSSALCTLSSEDVTKELISKQEFLQSNVRDCVVTSTESSIDLALKKTALHLCQCLLADQAVLLPTLYAHFLSFLPKSTERPSKARVLTYICNEFGYLMSSVCHHRKIGRIFFRTKADPYVLLSHALSSKHKLQSSPKSFSQGQTHCVTACADQINKQVHKVTSYMLEQAYKDDELIYGLDVDSFIQHINVISPELWEHICSLTQSVNERKGRKAAVSEDSLHGQIKFLRRAYLLSVILFTTNSECCYPFHVQLADAVETLGGSSELLTIFNRLGATASIPTLKRHIQTISQKRHESGVHSLLVDRGFTVASADNIDFLQSHAAVYSGSQHRSWHATSVQLVQPKPHSCQDGGGRNDSVSHISDPRGHISSSSGGVITSSQCNSQIQCSPVVSTPEELVENYLPVTRLKRTNRSSPINSPKKLTRSPCSKRFKRARTFTESHKLYDSEIPSSCSASFQKTGPRAAQGDINFQGFKLSSSETHILHETQKLMFTYMYQKDATDRVLMDLKSYYGKYTGTDTSRSEQSNVVYLSIVDKCADTNEAMEEVLSKLHTELDIGVKSMHLVLVGDQKTYTRLWELKHTYGTDLDWVLPFIGDWHLLSNFQSVLMKVYFDAGLKELAENAGFRGETLTSLAKCSNFKRTNQFIIQAWEALHRHMLSCYLSDSSTEHVNIMSREDIKTTLEECDTLCLSSASFKPLSEYIDASKEKLSEGHKSFMDYVSDMGKRDSTWKFWKEFVFRDAFAYICLFLSIRGGIWNLRTASIKYIAPMFTAFDRPHYRKLIPQHLKDLQTMPEAIQQFFMDGAFVCNILGSHMHSVALDEAHEMLINKGIKAAVVRPTKSYLDRVLYFFPVRCQALKQLKEQVLLHHSSSECTNYSIYNSSLPATKVEENISSMREKITASGTLSPQAASGSQLITFSGRLATPEQAKDLLSFWEIGEKHFDLYIRYFVLREPSAQVPPRFCKLLTFASSKRIQRKIKVIEKERKLVNKCIRRKMAWSSKTGGVVQVPGEQFLELPRALCDSSGNLNKGQKSYATKWLRQRYQNIIVNQLPPDWKPDAVIIDGMFIINTAPLNTHTCMKDYSTFLIRRYIVPWFAKGATEVHLIFDNPSSQSMSPKAFERRRRDNAGELPADHQHKDFANTAMIPSKWREHLQCRVCKRLLVLYLGQALTEHIPPKLSGNQKVILAGCYNSPADDQAWEISAQDHQPNPLLNSSAEEADTRIWLHVVRSCGRQKLVCSPDTDVYHIGLPFVQSASQDIYVQLSAISSPDVQLLHMKSLCLSLSNDPDLALTPREIRPKLLQSLFLCTGCDYISFFTGIGKATFLKVFFQHSSFINANTAELPGQLANTESGTLQVGFIAFARLVGSVYFKKHLSAFAYETPNALFNSCQGTSPEQTHRYWLDKIRARVWERIEFENDLTPSWEALWRHWLRSCWVSNMWSQAVQNHYTLLPLSEYGWHVSGDQLCIDWEDQSNVQKVRDTVSLLLKGCSCKKGCGNKRCGCFKNGKKCGPGCN